jgi:hypothetical protein
MVSPDPDVPVAVLNNENLYPFLDNHDKYHALRNRHVFSLKHASIFG